MTVEGLIGHLFGDAADDPLAGEVAGWLAGSRRFRSFADEHRDKIRKKLRGATEGDARRDVRVELRVAHLLLTDPRIELAFEAYGSGRRGPDFTLTFRRTRSFNLEVTRVRGGRSAPAYGRLLLAKLRQLPPSVPNALLMAIEDDAEVVDIEAVTRALRTRADRKEEDFFARRGFAGTKQFYEQYLRLGAVVMWRERLSGDERASLWSNRSARIALSQRAMQACLIALRQES